MWYDVVINYYVLYNVVYNSLYNYYVVYNDNYIVKLPPHSSIIHT
jgi:hypothetical protein